MARPITGGSLNLGQLEQILNNHKSSLTRLEKQKRDLLKKLDTIDRNIVRIGGASGIRRAVGRARNNMSLPEALDTVLRAHGKPMKVGDITQAVLATGYHSNSVSFRAIVNQTLIKERGRFSPVAGERGTYELKE